MVTTKYLSIKSQGNTDVLNITSECRDLVKGSGLNSGIVCILCPGSTGAVTTLEFEPNLVKDLKQALEIIAPSNKVYEHSKTWHDDNGFSHIRSALIGPSITVPFVDRDLILGTWQQIVFCDFDTRPRNRELIVQIVGE